MDKKIGLNEIVAYKKSQLIVWGLSVLLYISSHYINFGFWRFMLLMPLILPIYSISFIVISFMAVKFFAISKRIKYLTVFGHISFFFSSLFPDFNIRKEGYYIVFHTINTTDDFLAGVFVAFSFFMTAANIILQIILIVHMCRIKKNFKNNGI